MGKPTDDGPGRGRGRASREVTQGSDAEPSRRTSSTAKAASARVKRKTEPAKAPLDIDQRELERRLVHAMARLVSRFAGAFAMPLAQVVDLVQAAQLQTLRERGMTLAEIGRHMGVSERHAKRLLKQLRESFLDTERAYDLPVRIEFMVWAQPMSRAKIRQVLKDDPGAVDDAIDRLVASGRVIEDQGRTPLLRPSTSVQSLVRDTWLARIGALNSFVASLGDAVWGRFIEPSPAAFARTLNFLVRPEDLPEVQRFFTDQLVPHMTALDAAAQEAGRQGEATESLRLSICWAPYEAMTKSLESARPAPLPRRTEATEARDPTTSDAPETEPTP
jgi:AraC-like DNA-binding protein